VFCVIRTVREIIVFGLFFEEVLFLKTEIKDGAEHTAGDHLTNTNCYSKIPKGIGETVTVFKHKGHDYSIGEDGRDRGKEIRFAADIIRANGTQKGGGCSEDYVCGDTSGYQV